MTRHRRIFVPLIIVLAGATAGWMFFVRSPSAGTSSSRAFPRHVGGADRTFEVLGSFVDIGDAAAVTQALEAADLRGEVEFGAEDLRAVRSAAAEFLELRLARGASAAAYSQNRLRAGYRCSSDTVLDQVWEVRKMYELRRKSVSPKDRVALFNELASDDLDERGSGKRPVRMASDGRGIVIQFGEMRASNPVLDSVAGYFPAEVWRGEVSNTHLPFFAPPTDLATLLRRNGRVRYCRLGFIVENGAGERYPMVLTMIYDPGCSSWFLQHLNTYNSDVEAPLILH